jgi:uncharacterized protein YceK
MRYALLALAASLLLSSCATTFELPAGAEQPGAPAGMSTGKMKIRGPVTFQVGGTGNTAAPATTDNRKAGQRQGSAATAPGATASTTTQQAGTKWYWFALVGVGCVAAWEWLKKLLFK